MTCCIATAFTQPSHRLPLPGIRFHRAPTSTYQCKEARLPEARAVTGQLQATQVSVMPEPPTAKPRGASLGDDGAMQSDLLVVPCCKVARPGPCAGTSEQAHHVVDAGASPNAPTAYQLTSAIRTQYPAEPSSPFWAGTILRGTCVKLLMWRFLHRPHIIIQCVRAQQKLRRHQFFLEKTSRNIPTLALTMLFQEGGKTPARLRGKADGRT